MHLQIQNNINLDIPEQRIQVIMGLSGSGKSTLIRHINRLIEPTSGEINYKNVFKYIHSKGFNGILGMEHGNFSPGIEGEKKLILAYQEVDKFI